MSRFALACRRGRVSETWEEQVARRLGQDEKLLDNRRRRLPRRRPVSIRSRTRPEEGVVNRRRVRGRVGSLDERTLRYASRRCSCPPRTAATIITTFEI